MVIKKTNAPPPGKVKIFGFESRGWHLPLLGKSQKNLVRVPRLAPAGLEPTRVSKKGFRSQQLYLCATVPVNISFGCSCMGVLGVRVPHSSLYRDEVILIFLSLG